MRESIIPVPYKTILIACGLGIAFTKAAMGQPLELTLPIDCTLNETCWIARYMDRVSGNDKADYRGGLQTQDKHKGTDFAIQDLGAMEHGVLVLAAADGIVLRKRDGMSDKAVNDKNRKEIEGKECGNALILEHADGWQTQYCHLKQSSITVQVGDAVKAGASMAKVGLSGLTEFPHLHFMLRQVRDHQPPLDIDPFDGGIFESPQATNKQEKSFWRTTPAYSEAVVLPPLVTNTRTTRQTMWHEQRIINAASAEALIVQARGFHTQKRDRWSFSLVSPNGKPIKLKTIIQSKNRQLVQAYAGIKRPEGGFAPGIWSVYVELTRDGKTLSRRSSTVTVTQSTN